VLAPALFLVDNLLHPKEYSRGNEADQLAEIAEHYTRWQLAHLLGFLAIVGFVAAALGLAFLVRRRRPAAGLAGGVLAVLGIVCFAAIIALDGFTWGILGEVSGRSALHREVGAQTLHDVQQSEWSLQSYAPALAFAVGMALLGITAARSGAVPPPAGYLLALGAFLVGTEGLIVSNAYYVTGSAVLLAGAGTVGLVIARMSDEEFERGGPGSPPQP
jgi:hypothetical protein